MGYSNKCTVQPGCKEVKILEITYYSIKVQKCPILTYIQTFHFISYYGYSN